MARVKAQEYLKAMIYAATRRASDWNKMASLSEMLCWIELDSDVIVFVTVPTDTWSRVLMGWAKSDSMYCHRKRAEIRRPTVRKQNYSS